MRLCSMNTAFQCSKRTGKIAVVDPVEEFVALVRPRAGEKIPLIIAIEVHLELLAGGVVALQELVLDVRLAGRGNERRSPNPPPRKCR